MSVRFEDLPAEVRARLRAEHAGGSGQRQGKRTTGPANGPGAATPAGPIQHDFRCTTCGHESRSYAAAERHADEQRHHRIEAVL